MIFVDDMFYLESKERIKMRVWKYKIFFLNSDETRLLLQFCGRANEKYNRTRHFYH